MEDNIGVNIGTVGGDVFGVGISGSGNIVGKDISVDISGTVSINSQILNKLPEEYSVELKEFTDKLNEQIKRSNLTPYQVQAIKESVNELAKETEGISPNEEPPILKKQSWKEKFLKVLKNVLPVLPKAAETLAAFTPLAPFSKIIGETVERVVENYDK